MHEHPSALAVLLTRLLVQALVPGFCFQLALADLEADPA
jgi:hypothetical protein